MNHAVVVVVVRHSGPSIEFCWIGVVCLFGAVVFKKILFHWLQRCFALEGACMSGTYLNRWEAGQAWTIYLCISCVSVCTVCSATKYCRVETRYMFYTKFEMVRTVRYERASIFIFNIQSFEYLKIIWPFSNARTVQYNIPFESLLSQVRCTVRDLLHQIPSVVGSWISVQSTNWGRKRSDPPLG